MSKMIIVKGCKSCSYCKPTDDFDCYSGYKCAKNKHIGWSEEYFLKLADDSIDICCPLDDYENAEKKINIEDALDKVCVGRKTTDRLIKSAEYWKTDLTYIVKDELVSYLIKNGYASIKDEETDDGLIMKAELVVLNKKKLEELKKGGEE